MLLRHVLGVLLIRSRSLPWFTAAPYCANLVPGPQRDAFFRGRCRAAHRVLFPFGALDGSLRRLYRRRGYLHGYVRQQDQHCSVEKKNENLFFFIQTTERIAMPL